MLDKYIIDGRFLADQLKKDIEIYNETSAAKAYKLAYNAYLEEVLAETEKILFKSYIPYITNSVGITELGKIHA